MFKPNSWQTPHQFKSFMTFQMLTQGDAYAIISRAGNRITALTPIQSARVLVEQSTLDFSVSYRVTGPNGSSTVFQAGDVLHLSGLSADGVKGVSRLARAATAIQLANEAENSALKRFQLGAMIGGALTHPGKLGPEGREALRGALERNHSGSENAGRWMILEEGLKAEPFVMSAIDAQLDETRRRQIEEIGKVFAVPRPLLNVDDTSWGSGVEQLSMLFVSYTLNPWFKIWEDSLQLACLDESEWGTVVLDFDDRQLLRGSMKDQADFYAKALGSGGHKPWMEANEVREDLGLGAHEDGSGLVMAGQEGTQNEPRQTA
jgi:HK97 family phage portal protein